jgi:hypothetical protein
MISLHTRSEKGEKPDLGGVSAMLSGKKFAVIDMW